MSGLAFSMKTVPVATFNQREPAQLLQRRLEEHGFEVRVHDESKLERFLFMSEPLAAIHVEVKQPDYLRARHLIAEWDQAEGVMHRAVHCPQCHSTRIEFPQMTRKFVTTSIFMLLAVFRLVPREFYCLDCHYTWPKISRHPKDRDLLGFPFDSRVWHPENAHSHERG